MLKVNLFYLKKNMFKSNKSLLFEVSQANMIEFMFLISKPSYPAEQRVLRIENLPQNCSTMEIKKYFEGL